MGEVERPRLYRTLRSFLVPQMTMPMVRCDVRGGGEALAVIAATRDGRTLMMLRNFTRDESGWPVLGRITTHSHLTQEWRPERIQAWLAPRRSPCSYVDAPNMPRASYPSDQPKRPPKGDNPDQFQLGATDLAGSR